MHDGLIDRSFDPSIDQSMESIDQWIDQSNGSIDRWMDGSIRLMDGTIRSIDSINSFSNLVLLHEK